MAEEEGKGIGTLIALLLGLLVLVAVIVFLIFKGNPLLDNFLQFTGLQSDYSSKPTQALQPGKLPLPILYFNKLHSLAINGVKANKFYIHPVEYLENRYKDKKDTPLYLNTDKKAAKSYIDKDGNIILNSEDDVSTQTITTTELTLIPGNAKYANILDNRLKKYSEDKTKFDKGEEIPVYFQPNMRVRVADIYKGGEGGSGVFDGIIFKKVDGKVYMAFAKEEVIDARSTRRELTPATPYILRDYWIVYQNLMNFPDWAQLKEKK